MQSTQTKNSPLKGFAHPVLRDIQSTTIAPSQSVTHYLPGLPSTGELYTSIPDAFDFHKQVRESLFLTAVQSEHTGTAGPWLHFADPGPAQYDLEEDTNDINGNMHYVPHDLLCAPRPMPADFDSILGRHDCATRIPWQVRPISVYTLALKETGLRAALPAPFTFYKSRECVEAESIIPNMIHQKLVDIHGMPMYPPPFFNMPDTRLYAQFISNFCQHKDAITRSYYSKVPRNPCFPDDLEHPRIYPIELLKRLHEHLERYMDAFPEPLPMVIIRNSEVICMNPPCWYMYGVIVHVPPTEHPNSENLEDTLWSMSLKRGVSASYRPCSGGQPSVATSPVQFGNMIYSAEELTYFNFAVNVFMEVPMFPGSGLKEPAAAYKGAFILNVIDHPMHPACWTELSEDRKMDIYERAPQLFGGVPTFSKCPTFPAVNLHFQNWDMNLLGVLDDLKFGTVDYSLDVGQCKEEELGSLLDWPSDSM